MITAKGIRGFDAEKAYEDRRINYTLVADYDFYYKNGYFPALQKGEKETVSLVHSFEKRQAVAVTLGGSYDDWAVGQLATELNKPNDQAIFAKRATNYKNLWNDDKKMFIPKDKDGNWINIDPKFADCLDGFLVLDLEKVPQDILEKLGKNL